MFKSNVRNYCNVLWVCSKVTSETDCNVLWVCSRVTSETDCNVLWVCSKVTSETDCNVLWLCSKVTSELIVMFCEYVVFTTYKLYLFCVQKCGVLGRFPISLCLKVWCIGQISYICVFKSVVYRADFLYLCV